MSMLNRPANSTDIGEVVASMRDYEAAQKTVSKLIAGEVPARDIAIVGQGIRTVERITGRLGYATAARSGAGAIALTRPLPARGGRRDRRGCRRRGR